MSADCIAAVQILTLPNYCILPSFYNLYNKLYPIYCGTDFWKRGKG